MRGRRVVGFMKRWRRGMKMNKRCANIPSCEECPFCEGAVECRINTWVYGDDHPAKSIVKKGVAFIVIAIVMILMGSTPC